MSGQHKRMLLAAKLEEKKRKERESKVNDLEPLMKAKKWDEILEKTKDAKPENKITEDIPYIIRRAEALSELNRNDESIKLITRGYQCFPKQKALFLKCRANHYRVGNDIDKALKDCEECVEVCSNQSITSTADAYLLSGVVAIDELKAQTKDQEPDFDHLTKRSNYSINSLGLSIALIKNIPQTNKTTETESDIIRQAISERLLVNAFLYSESLYEAKFGEAKEAVKEPIEDKKGGKGKTKTEETTDNEETEQENLILRDIGLLTQLTSMPVIIQSCLIAASLLKTFYDNQSVSDARRLFYLSNAYTLYHKCLEFLPNAPVYHLSLVEICEKIITLKLDTSVVEETIKVEPRDIFIHQIKAARAYSWVLQYREKLPSNTQLIKNERQQQYTPEDAKKDAENLKIDMEKAKESLQNLFENSKYLKDQNISSVDHLYKAITLCETCYKEEISDGGAAKFKLCSKCCKICYCSRECQLKHWPVHKLLCKKPQDDTVPLDWQCHTYIYAFKPKKKL